MSENIRLSRRLTELGLVASRREADECIEMGFVRVDGETVQALGSRVNASQTITLERSKIQPPPSRITLLLNKPAGIANPLPLLQAATRCDKDRSGWAWLSRCSTHLQEAGWLDADSSGLMVLTQDDALASRLTRDARDYEQEYLVWVEGGLDEAALARLNAIRELDDGPLLPFKASRQGGRQLRLVLRENREYLVHRLLDEAGLKIQMVKRQRIGRIALGPLEEGQWRYLMMGERF
ncbi:pseudouridine synthase [Craterilacuibacter sp. RT1T]|uniref:pseudouridine synthase n=1 Tax=Craterilacuibacter sp. RT1T TaxID=2942211 RepID=UPI0020C13888|nr:pseudouridine synthase [Craterilacuibacter sp. RT1T]MCL6263248.1 pseudouridine synthase [Craterilacuibacter sp. RT1T]